MTNDRNLFWLDEPSILYRNKNYLNFFPQYEMTRVEQLNAITRFCIYSILLLIIFGRNEKWIYIPIIIIILVVIFYNIYLMDPQGREKELYRQKGERFESNDISLNDNGLDYDLESGFYDSDDKLHLGQEYTATTKNPYKKIDYDLNEMLDYQKAT